MENTHSFQLIMELVIKVNHKWTIRQVSIQLKDHNQRVISGHNGIKYQYYYDI